MCEKVSVHGMKREESTRKENDEVEKANYSIQLDGIEFNSIGVD